ncbi:MAG: hypothetical protein HQ567_30610 [Candidatus Nealsonbacteria bacterium]|nr:hypothetical protein [Candidatus Nealsonbacteria bacterium]
MRICTFLLLTVAAVRPAPADVTRERIDRAVTRGVEFLRQQQADDGTWAERWFLQKGGVTALCTLALLQSGVEPTDEQVQRSLKILRTVLPKTTYVTSLQTMVLCRAKLDTDLAMIRRNVQWLENIQVQDGPNKGAWSYPSRGTGGDKSNTRFAMLALHEARQAGVDVSKRTWRLALRHWVETQNADGSWSYRTDSKTMPGSGSMTCSGIASIAMASAQLDGEDDLIASGKEPTQRAVDWLAKNFSVERNPGVDTWHFYYLHTLRSAGRLTQQTEFGRHDWYAAGADYLVRQQDMRAGWWKGRTNLETDPAVATALALLFLAEDRR